MSEGKNCSRFSTGVIQEEIAMRRKAVRARRCCMNKRMTVSDDLILQPWFLTKSISHAVRRLIPHQFESRMHWYFDDYGCIRCGRRNTLYRANGFCSYCRATIKRRLMQSIKRRANTVANDTVQPPSKWYFRRAEAAERLLREFVKRPKRPNEPPVFYSPGRRARV